MPLMRTIAPRRQLQGRAAASSAAVACASDVPSTPPHPYRCRLCLALTALVWMRATCR